MQWAGVLAPLTAALLSLGSASLALRIWRWEPGTPLALGGDSTFVTMQLGRLVGGPALRDASRLGAPFGQTTGWFPSDDQIHFLVVKLLGLFLDSPYTVGAVYFLAARPYRRLEPTAESAQPATPAAPAAPAASAETPEVA